MRGSRTHVGRELELVFRGLEAFFGELLGLRADAVFVAAAVVECDVPGGCTPNRQSFRLNRRWARRDGSGERSVGGTVGGEDKREKRVEKSAVSTLCEPAQQRHPVGLTVHQTASLPDRATRALVQHVGAKVSLLQSVVHPMRVFVSCRGVFAAVDPGDWAATRH